MRWLPKSDARSLYQESRLGHDDTSGLNLALGWYVAARSTHLGRQPRRADLFGRQFVVWRDANGSPTVMAARCPHMGAALFDGRIVGGLLECPFHHWRFASDGRCAELPSGHRVPPTARATALPSIERFGYVWVWYGSHEPMYSLPEMQGLDTGWSNRFTTFQLEDATRTTARRILENTYDPDHLVALHGLKVAGQPAVQTLSEPDAIRLFGPAKVPNSRLPVALSWPAYTGWLGRISSTVGLNAERFELLVEGWPTFQHVSYLADGVTQYSLLLAVTPVGRNMTTQHVTVAVHQATGLLVDLLRSAVHRIEVTVAARQDLPIFNSMRPDDKHGIYVATDRGVREFRAFYQKWVEKAEAHA